jgi:lysophospholipase
MAEPAQYTEFIESKDGTQLFCRMMGHPESPATLLFIHGFGEHSGRYEHVMTWFHRRGYDVASFDYRGHGKAQGRRGHVQAFRDYNDDVDAFVRWAMSRSTGDRRLFMVGHSLGGLISAGYVLEQPEGIDGLVLSSPFLGLKMKVPAAKVAAGKVMSRVLPTFSMPAGVPPEYLSTDPAVGEAYTKDPLVGTVCTARWFTETMAWQQRVLRGASSIRVPVLLLQAGDDKIADPNVSQAFLAAVGSADKEMQWYDGLYHEIFNERDKETVFADLAAWLDKHVR